MTFKHIKFEDSVVMRSLEKIAKEKGLIKESIQKTASNNDLDLKASSNLMENILKLSTGLRNIGLDTFANELESNFLSYKRAKNLYDTSDKGEDLIHKAHPDGSHKVENVLGDDFAVVETILDRHLKMLDVINKKPSGKLASFKLINEVKLALAEDPEGTYESITARANNLLHLIRDDIHKVKSVSDSSLVNKLADSIIAKNEDINKMTLQQLSNILANINGISELLDPGWIASSESKLKWQSISPILYRAQDNAKTCLWLKQNLIKKENIKKTEEVPDVDAKPITIPTVEIKSTDTYDEDLSEDFNTQINEINRFKAIIKAKALPNSNELNVFLDKVSSFLVKNKNEYNASGFKNDPQIKNTYKSKIDAAKLKLNQFKTKWL